jgi:hypothetical protein
VSVRTVEVQVVVVVVGGGVRVGQGVERVNGQRA